MKLILTDSHFVHLATETRHSMQKMKLSKV